MEPRPQSEIRPTLRGAKHLTTIGHIPAWLDRPATKPAPSPAPHRRSRAVGLRARYDAADTGPENRNHWSLADDLSANAAGSSAVRQTLRRRARYERDNDPHLSGLTKQLADDLVGTGPRLQLNLGDEHTEAAALVAKSWKAWCRAADLGEKLRLMHEPRSPDGETFGIFFTNPQIRHAVKLDLRILEAEQVQTPQFSPDAGAVDGIEFDGFGNPTYYHVLRQHPGDSWAWNQEYDRVPARLVLHWFRPCRPSQARGISELAAALPIGSQTRRYSAAVLMKAEYAAGVSGVMTTDLPTPDDADEEDPVSMDEVSMPRGSLITLPFGWKADFAETEPPSDSYVSFVDAKRGEMGRAVRAPRNLVTGDSSQFNFASGRLDHLPYQSMTWIERDRFRQRVIDRIFLAWYAEAELVGLIPDTLPALNEWEWDWHWDAFPSLNPIDDATTSEKRLTLGLTTLAEECAADGKDWREVLTQRAAEKEFAESLGLTLPWLAPTPMPATALAPSPADEDEPVDEIEEAPDEA